MSHSSGLFRKPAPIDYPEKSPSLNTQTVIELGTFASCSFPHRNPHPKGKHGPGIPSGPGPGHADADIATKLGAADEPTAGTDMATKPTATANIANTRRANFMEISP